MPHRAKSVKGPHGARLASGPTVNGDAVRKFRRFVGEIAKRNFCPRTEAMRRAADEHPEEFEAYRSA